MVPAMLCAGLVATLFSSAALAPGTQPSNTGLEATQRPSAAAIDSEGTLAWEVAMVDHKGKCPGARE